MKRLLAAIGIALWSGVAPAQTLSSTGQYIEQDAQAGPVDASTSRGNMMWFDAGNTPGWTMMTTQEQQAYREKMNSVTTVGECNAYVEQHIRNMRMRAREENALLQNQSMKICDTMQKRGMLGNGS